MSSSSPLESIDETHVGHLVPLSLIEVEPEITAEYLAEISQDIFHSDIPGQAAASILEHERRQAWFNVHSYPLDSNRAMYLSGLWGTDIGPRVFTGQVNEVRDAVVNAVDNSSSPFDFAIELANQVNGVRRPYLEGTPLEAQKERLHRYLKDTGLSQHGLHGTLGRAADVLNVAAEAADPTVDEEYDPSRFLSWKSVFEQIATRIERYRPYYIQRKVDGLVEAQLLDGQPTPNGEIILEGPYDRTSQTWTSQRSASQQVAKASLISLADSYSGQTSRGPGPRSVLPDILRDIATS